VLLHDLAWGVGCGTGILTWQACDVEMATLVEGTIVGHNALLRSSARDELLAPPHWNVLPFPADLPLAYHAFHNITPVTEVLYHVYSTELNNKPSGHGSCWHLGPNLSNPDLMLRILPLLIVWTMSSGYLSESPGTQHRLLIRDSASTVQGACRVLSLHYQLALISVQAPPAFVAALVVT
jgi:hypothetical protein